MPCQCDYMDANDKEIRLSRVACLLDELNGIPVHKNDWNGYHSKVYNRGLSKKDADAMVSELCYHLQKVDDITKYSLEMQMWWRDHQAADQRRVVDELKDAATQKQREAALAKLTEHERKLLGL